ncbi:sensor histidine kinase [Comamonas sp. UBA7528]|uniref:sensor histidine kinase n=1 Tax=Comamonas sp. UBA7528 TaxID=1946391 RepID=UPI0025BBB11F|nr:ATP-binding protein [Comamonas sp. UBA7528]
MTGFGGHCLARSSWWLCSLLLAWLCWLPAAHASAAAMACNARVDSIMAARADTDATRPPSQGWETVTLPDNWSRRWPGHSSPVWYRITWRSDCPSTEPIAMIVDSINMAGEVYSNQDLIWRDHHLQEPLSRSWTTARTWVLPQSSLQPQGSNTIWVRVVGVPELSPGLGVVDVGSPDAMLASQRHHEWNTRTLFQLNLTLSATLGIMALVVWLPRRKQALLGWYALVSLCWVLFGSNVLLTETWPFPDSLTMARANHLAYIGFIASFAVFCWQLIASPLSRVQLQRLGALTLVAFAVVVASPGWFPMQRAADLYTLIFLGNTVLVIRHAWRTGELQHRFVAVYLLLMVSMGVRDLLVVVEIWPSRDFYSAYTALLFMLLSAVLMRRRILQDAQRIERFNQELSETVARACDELNTTLSQEHALALANAHLQERLQLAQDLHDGLGGQIVRSIMLVEQSDAPPSKERYLSMLKLLRDDLRQVVDSDGSIGANAPTTPEEWTIPLRYRFATLFDDLDMHSEWLAPPVWDTPPSALQCMLLARVAEEALTNIVKHSQARMVRVNLRYPDATQLVLCIEDDGIGFDAPTALRAGLGIGMSSMRARMERMGGALHVRSRPGNTVIEACLPLAEQGAAASLPVPRTSAPLPIPQVPTP